MREKLLSIIEKNSRIELKDLAVILGMEEIDIVNELQKCEEEGIICGYHTLIDWDKVGIEKVSALIEVRVTPQRGQGFDSIAERIYKYPEVHAVFLISGGYDLLVSLEGKTLREVSAFVSNKLSSKSFSFIIDICLLEIPCVSFIASSPLNFLVLLSSFFVLIKLKFSIKISAK